MEIKNMIIFFIIYYYRITYNYLLQNNKIKYSTFLLIIIGRIYRILYQTVYFIKFTLLFMTFNVNLVRFSLF